MDTLDQAWSDAEAAMPEGWRFELSPYFPSGWEATAWDIKNYQFDFDPDLWIGTGGAFESPIDALRDLIQRAQKKKG